MTYGEPQYGDTSGARFDALATHGLSKVFGPGGISGTALGFRRSAMREKVA